MTRLTRLAIVLTLAIVITVTIGDLVVRPYAIDRLEWQRACADLKEATENALALAESQRFFMGGLLSKAGERSAAIGEDYYDRYCGWSIWLPWKQRPS